MAATRSMAGGVMAAGTMAATNSMACSVMAAGAIT